MKKITIKVLVDKDITACAQMREKLNGSKWSDFVCGVDLAGHVLITNSPQVWGRTFLELAENIIIAERYRNNPLSCLSYNHLEDIEYLTFCDDSQALVSVPEDMSMEDYYAESDKVTKEQREELSKYLDRVLRGLKYNEETAYYEGYITINI